MEGLQGTPEELEGGPSMTLISNFPASPVPTHLPEGVDVVENVIVERFWS